MPQYLTVPSVLDTWEERDLVHCRNGTIITKTGVFVPHSERLEPNTNRDYIPWSGLKDE